MNVSRTQLAGRLFFYLVIGFAAFSGMDAVGQGGMFPPLPNSDLKVNKPLSKPEKAGLIFKREDVSEGYILIATRAYTATHLIDSDGYVVHEWSHQKVAAASAYLLPNGNLLHTVRNSVGDIGSIVQELTWDGEVVWEYTTDQDVQRMHHDVELLPNGNVLITVWEKKSKGEYVAAGRNPDTVPGDVMWVDAIYEIKKTGKTSGDVVWRWSPWNHLIQNYDANKPHYGDPAESPNLIDLNQVRENKKLADWLHINSVFYDSGRDEIMLSIHSLDEIWVVSRKTGELVYRWGNPQRYGKGGAEDHLLSGQHDAHRIADGLHGAGNLLIFNNQAGFEEGEGPYSSILEVALPPYDLEAAPKLTDCGIYPPGNVVWEYTGAPSSKFHSSNFSGAQRLKSGGTLICVGVYGVIFEVNPDGRRVWEYVNPVFREGPGLRRLEDWNTLPTGGGNGLFRARKYPPDYPAFEGRNLFSKKILGE